MNKFVLQAGIFGLAIILTLELSLRFMYFGTDALSPEKMNSHILILDSEFVQPASYPDIYYELRPSITSIFRGKTFVTNSAGLADQEYTLSKPADVYRIAVIGSSWTMGTGIEAGHAYEAILEERLSNTPSDKRVEILNFGVEYYGLGEMIGTVTHKVLAYDPDMIIFAITSVTPLFLWEEHKESFVVADTVPPFSRFYVASAVMETLGKRLYTNTRRPRVKPLTGTFMRQIQRAMESLHKLTADENIPVAVLWLSYDVINESMVSNTARHAGNQGFTFLSINLMEKAELYGFSGNLLTGRIDRHPNEMAHEVIAETLYQELLKDSLP